MVGSRLDQVISAATRTTVDDDADDRDEHVTTLFVGPQVAPKRRQDPQQDRQDRHREADQGYGRGGPVTAVKHRQQGSKQGSSEQHRNRDTKRCTGETLVPSTGLLPR